jgi:hypothetical protein
MKVDPQQLLEDGYLILRQVVQPDQLDALRLSVEVLVDRQKARSAAERGADESLGGTWYAAAQPRLFIDELLCAETANVVDLVLGERTFGVSQQLMCAPETVVNAMMVLCSGLIEFGYTDWHRDSSAAEQAPLGGLQADLQDNMPGYLQWNIPLYDDDVLWVVPGSHRRPDNEEQRRQLLLDPRVELPGGVPVDLKAGDAVVYTNLIMHWGSFYSSRLRRTIHLGYRSFGGEIFPYSHHFHYDEGLGFTRHLSTAAAAKFEQFVALFRQERDQIEQIWRAVIARDAAAFCAGLEKLHPGKNGRMVSVVLLSRMVDMVGTLHRPEIATASDEVRAAAVSGPADPSFYEDLARRFTAEEAATLQRRFATLSARLQADGDVVHAHYAALLAEHEPDAEPPNFASRPLRTFHTEMPDFSEEDFIRSWDS